MKHSKIQYKSLTRCYEIDLLLPIIVINVHSVESMKVLCRIVPDSRQTEILQDCSSIHEPAALNPLVRCNVIEIPGRSIVECRVTSFSDMVSGVISDVGASGGRGGRRGGWSNPRSICAAAELRSIVRCSITTRAAGARSDFVVRSALDWS